MGLPAEAGICQTHQLPIQRECARCGDFGCASCFVKGSTLCIRCAPGGERKLDLGASLKWPFSDPALATSILLGAVCVLFSFLLVPMFILQGYQLRIARAVRQDERAALPTWDEPGALLWDGFKSWLAMFLPVFVVEAVLAVVFVVVVVVIAFVAAGSASGGGGRGGGPPPGAILAGVAGELIFIFFVAIFSLVVAYVHPAIELRYLRTGSPLCGFEVRELWKIIATRPGRYAELFIFLLVVGLIASLVGQLALCVGLLATIPWSMYVQAHLLGSHWARDDLEADVG
jgi:hypothetical protein